MRRLVLPLLTALLLFATACGDVGDPSLRSTAAPTQAAVAAEPTASEAAPTVDNPAAPTASADTRSPPPTMEPASAPPVAATPFAFTRLGSHLFMPVGQPRSIAGLGELIETISMDGSDVFGVDGTEITASGSGAACFRFQYRDEFDENGVQTVCAIAFERVGECGDLPRLRLDLNAFLDSEQQSAGDANLLESGSGEFYAACIDDHSRYVLQPSTTDLPRLYWRIVDALGGGPYSLGDPEMASQRVGVVTTFSGEEVRPPWIVPVGREITELEITPDGLAFNANDCEIEPACTTYADALLPGDVISIGAGLPFEATENAIASYTVEQLDQYFFPRTGVHWSAVLQRDSAIGPAVLARMFTADVISQVIPGIDAVHDIRGKGLIVGYNSSPLARSIMPLCRPEPENRAGCQALENAIAAYEASQVEALIADGYDLWLSVGVEYREGGEYDSVAEHWRPHLSSFNGVIGLPAANDFWATDDIAQSIADAVRGLASELLPEQKVILTLGGPPITANTGAGGFCEAEICPSDFDAAYEQFEAWLSAALDAFAPGQLAGIGTALFEGSHFDIREPYEEFSSFALNRVGETGYNHPALNVWRAR